MMSKYLHQDYLYHSKIILKLIYNKSKINDLTDGLLSSVLIIIAEGIMIIALIALIIFFKQINTFNFSSYFLLELFQQK